jgi:hypothetical protein
MCTATSRSDATSPTGRCALEWLRREHGATRFIVGGLCGGALTGLLVAEREPSIEALLSIGMTVTLDSDSAMPSKYLTQFELAHLRQGYLAKLLNPRAWLRLLTFRSDFGVIVRSMLAGLLKKRRSGPSGAASDSGAGRARRSPPSSSPTSTRSSRRPSSPSSAAAGGR